MTAAELERKYDLMEEALNAIIAGNYEKAHALNKDIVISPEAAMQSFRVMGKERLLATEINLSAANAAFGEGWLDEEATQGRRL